MKIRTATLQDLAAVTALEAACFPAAEAAPEAAFRARLETYPESFWVMPHEADRPVAMVNGMCTDTPDLHDEMYENATLHDRAGEWQMIFGVATHPEHQKKGYAGPEGQGRGGALLRHVGVCRRGHVGLEPRRGGLASDAGEVLKLIPMIQRP